MDTDKLQLGAGSALLSGWINTDIDLDGNSSYLDVTKPFPFDDDTFRYVFCEHLIEHLSYQEGLFMLRECRRVLRSGGILRVATPDLAQLLGLFNNKLSQIQRRYIKYLTDNYAPDTNYRPCHVINIAFRTWGHQFIYDEVTLGDALIKAGFTKALVYDVGDSDDSNLVGIEMHGKTIRDEELNMFETMVFEAS